MLTLSNVAANWDVKLIDPGSKAALGEHAEVNRWCGIGLMGGIGDHSVDSCLARIDPEVSSVYMLWVAWIYMWCEMPIAACLLS